VVPCLAIALAFSLVACDGDSESEGRSDNSRGNASPVATAPGNGATLIGAGSGSVRTLTQPANTSGRLLASNCFQCHGTLGTGGFDSIRSKDADELLEYMSKPASSDIMAAHAQGYTRAQLQLISSYLKQ
jgi:sulfide dehydrogenase cytochrome subunit